MLVDNVGINTEVEKRDRNYLIRIYSELERGSNVRIECHREVVLVKDGSKWDTGGANGERRYMVSKLLAEIAADEVTLPPEYGGITLTGAQVAAALEMLSDLYAESQPSSSSSSSA